MTEERRIWIKLGDHTEEGEAIIRECQTQNDTLVGTPDLRRRRSPHGWSVTVLAAAGPWWLEYMRVYGSSWRTMTEDELGDFLDRQQPGILATPP